MRFNLISSRWRLMVIISSVFLTLNTVVFGVPLSMSYSNQENEHYTQEKDRDDKKFANSSCIVNGSNYEEGKHVPGAGPCEECICHPPNVVCSMIKCPINSGCITIQLPNKCCPKYKCDCEHKGKQYNNGEKINKSDESACRVCFCNGGEIVCTSIVCYTRIDCKGYYLPGDCCPKYDNCSSTPIEQKPKESINSEKSIIHYWSQSTAQSYSEGNIWKRDTTESQKPESHTVPNEITMSPTFFDNEKESRQRNMSLPHNFFEELYQSTPNSMIDKNITLNGSNSTTNTPDELETIGEINTTISSKTSFLGFETDNLTTNEEFTDISLTTNEPLDIIPQFEDLFDITTDSDNSLVFANNNDTITILDETEAPNDGNIINSSTETTITQVEIVNPNDIMLNTEQSMFELSTITPELEVTTEIDNEESREATTPRSPDKSTISTPHKLLMDSKQKNTEDEINTEITFTDLEDTTDMFGPNFGYRLYKTQTQQVSVNADTINSRFKVINYETTFSPETLSNLTNSSNITIESSHNKLFTNSDILSIENNTSVNMGYVAENSAITTNKPVDMYNSSNFLERESNFTECINNSCKNHSKQNDKLTDFQTEPSSTTPFIIETKILPNQESSRIINKKMPYPKEYPEEFETIQNGPSLTITKKTYTSIPDIVYTTTTMITLPTLDLIYKADKEIENYLAGMQSTTNKPSIKPNNSLSPLRNVSSINYT